MEHSSAGAAALLSNLLVICISAQLVNQWLPRGFAVVHSDAPGTGRSEGCPTLGDKPERTAMKYVIDWLNGRARGYTTPRGSEEVKATSHRC